jgi:hypothetical protein
MAIAAASLAVLRAQQVGPNVNIVSGSTLPGGDPYLQRQNEPSGAVSTRNPLHLFAGANDYRTVDVPGLPADKHTGDAWLGIFKSSDGGQVWRSSLLPGYPQDQTPAGLVSPLKGYEAGADAVVRSSTNGLFYYSGIVFNRGSNAPSAVFVSRFIDNNNASGVDQIAYLDTHILATGTKRPTGPAPQFVDKPFMVVDIPRAGAKTCSISAPGTSAVQRIPAGTVYVAYMLFENSTSATTPPTSKLMVTRSLDCGETWSNPSVASDRQHTEQGVAMAIDPSTGALYLAWREFAGQGVGDSILVTKSIDLGRGIADSADPKGKGKPAPPLKFASPTTIATIAPFDQGDSATTFRTNSYPSLAVDAERIYVTFAERGWGPSGPSVSGASGPGAAAAPVDGDARIVVMVGTPTGKNTKGRDVDDDREKINWSDRRPIDNTPLRGHQIMPAASIVAGRLTVIFKDFRDDQSRVFGPYIDEANIYQASTPKRHTLDVRVSQALVPDDTPDFTPSVLVSQYLRGSRPGSRTIEQLQFNAPNLPLYAQGTTPFVGDYLDLAGQTFVQDAGGHWAFNMAANGPGVQYAFWTDNRDVRPPSDGNWAHYTPPTSAASSQSCAPGQTGMRNANIYSARISPGLLVGSPANSKRLSSVTRSFVVFAQNNTDTIRRYRFTITNQPPGGQASFLQFSPAGSPLTTLDATLAPRSSASRTVYVTSSNPTATVNVSVVEVIVPVTPTATPPIKPGGLTGTIVLNPDVTNPDVTNPDVTNAEVFNPDVTNPDVTNPDVTNPDVTNPDVTNPDVTNVRVANPDVTNPDVTNPDVTNPDVTNPDVTNPDVTNPDVTNGAYIDVTWTVKNNGNIAGTFNVDPFVTKNAPPGFKLQLLLYKVYTTPVTLPSGCAVKTQSQTVLIANIVNPDVTNPDVTNKPLSVTGKKGALFKMAAPRGFTPAAAGAAAADDATDPSVTNATLWLEPGESAKITLRVLAPDKTQLVTKQVTQSDGTVTTVLVAPAFDVTTIASVAVAPEAVGTADAANGVTEPPVDIALVVTSTSLPGGQVGSLYDAILAASGGSGPRTWSLLPAGGSLPPGLLLNSATGEIVGTPTVAGLFPFTVQVTDTAVPMHVNTLPLSILVSPPSGAVNQAPVPLDDPKSAVEDTPLVFAASTLTSNDSQGAGESGQTLTVTAVTATASTHGTVQLVSGTVTYTPAGNYNGPASFQYTVCDDGTTNGSPDPKCASGNVNVTVASVNDVPSFAKGADQTVNRNAGLQSVPGWATAISSGPVDESGQALNFIVSPTNPSLFSVAPAVSPTGTLTYTPAANAAGSSLVTVTLHDSGGVGNSGVDTSAAQTFTITVTAINVAPSFTKGADQTVNEDAGAQSVAGWATLISAGPPDESGQALNFLVSPANPGLFSVAPAVSPTGTLTYTPALNAVGSSLVTATLHDNGGIASGGVDTSAAQTFTITLTGVNDVPSFTKGADQTVNRNAGAQSVPGWATAMSAGPADESGQAVDFLVSATNTGLFLVQPSVSPTGTLTYAPAVGASGSSVVTVRIHDDGGTALGGVDTSAPQTFNITFTASGAQTFVVIGTGDSGPGSLRQAILDANANAGQLDTITFNITGGGGQTIAVLSPLPTITDPVIIDATTQPGFAGQPIIELNGSGAGAGSNGLLITGGGSTIRGFVINRFSSSGISISGAGGNVIAGNFLGTNFAGTAASGTGTGVLVSGSPNNTIGGTVVADRNVISGNGSGVSLSAAGASGNLVEGNYIGLNASGTAAIANSLGVNIQTATGNVIGGTSAGARNVISGNAIGLGVAFSLAPGNIIQGNYIGLNPAGTAAIANTTRGVQFSGGAVSNTFGGTTPGAGNVVSGNPTGIQFTANSNNNLVQGNIIGLNAAATAALPNATGILVQDSSGNAIGGTTTGAGNVISANTGIGLSITAPGSTGSAGVGGTLVQGNTINAGGIGIQLTTASGVTIGGTAAGAPNVIAFNNGRGVNVVSGTGNAISGNTIFANGSLGIDLGGNGVTANDAGSPPDQDTGANNLQNFPVLTLATSGASLTTIAGTLASTPSTTFRIELFANDSCDGSGNGEGQEFIAATNVTTNGSGNASFNQDFPLVATGRVVTATATDPNGNTSEFGSCRLVVGPSSFAVSTTADSGPGSLRQAILNANANGGVVDTITFGIPGGGAQTIAPLSALPTITDPVIIDATTEPGFAGQPIIELNGSSAGGGVNGLSLSAGSSTVRGLVINRFTAAGIVVSGAGGNVIATNYIGLNLAGNAASANGTGGIRISNSPNNTIGGTAPGARNVVSGSSTSFDIDISGAAATGNIVQGNYLGLNAAGTGGLSVAGFGISISSSGNVVGGTSAAARNVISGHNPSIGVLLSNPAGPGNLVQGNYIGLNAAGTAAVPNGGSGIQIGFPAAGNVVGIGNTIGGTSPGAGNVISGNTNGTGAGISFFGGANGNTVQGNLIGVNAAGTAAIANSLGIYISDSPNNTIGGTLTAAANVISGNTGLGVFVTAPGTSGTAGVGGTLVQGNIIGTDPTGTIAIPNATGIQLTLANGVTIGGTAAGAANSIARNTGVGVSVVSGTGNSILGNAIQLNGGLGIDLGANGVSANDAGSPPDQDTGANNLQNFPVLTLAETTGSALTVTGSLPSTPSTAFRIEIFTNGACDGSGNGEGQQIVGAFTATTDATGIVGFSQGFAGAIAPGQFLTATATDPSGNTSEFSACRLVTAQPNANQAPSFTKGADQTVNENAGAQSVFSWASNISAGPANESGQLVNFLVSSDNPSLFAAAPAVSPGGLLTYTPATNAHGSAIVTVQIHDNGGVANGGVDTSAPQTFTITVNAAPNSPPVAVDDSASGNQAAAIVINVLSNDSDPNNDVLSVSVTTPAGHGSAIANADKTITYTGGAGFFGTDTFGYTIDDGHGGTASATVTVTVNHVNHAPVAVNDAAAIIQGDTNGINVLTNDIDVDRSPATLVASISSLAAGVSLNPGFLSEAAVVNSTGIVYAIGSRAIAAIDPATNAVTAVFTQAAGGGTQSRVNQTTGLLYFRQGSAIVAVDARPASPTYNTVVATLRFGATLNSFDIDETHGRLYAMYSGSQGGISAPGVSVIDIDPAHGTFHQIVDTVPLASAVAPRQLAVNPVANVVYFTAGDGIYFFPGGSHVVTKVPSSAAAGGIVVNPASNLVFASTVSGTVFAIDGNTEALLNAGNAIPVPGFVTNVITKHMAVNTVTGRVYVRSNDTGVGNTGKVFVIDGNRASGTFLQVIATVPVGHDGGATDVVVDEGANRVVTTSPADLRTDVIDGVTHAVTTLASIQATGDVAINPVTHLAYIASTLTSLQVIGLTSVPSVIATVGVAAEGGVLAVDTSVHRAFVGPENASAPVRILNKDGAAGTVTGLPTAAGRYSWVVANPTTHRVYALNSDSNTTGSSTTPPFVSVIDSTTGAAITSIPVGNSAFGLGINLVTNKIYVGGSTITVIDGATNTATTANTSDPALSGVGFSRDTIPNTTTNKIYFRTNSSTVPGAVLNGATNVVTPLLASTFGTISIIRVNSTLNRVYIGNTTHHLFVLNGADDSIIADLDAYSASPFIGTQQGIAVDESNGHVYVLGDDLLEVLDGATNATLAQFYAGQGATSVAVNPLTHRVYVGAAADKMITFVDGTTLNIVGWLTVPLEPDLLVVDAAESRIYTSNGAAAQPGLMVIEDASLGSSEVLTINNVTQGAKGLVEIFFNQVIGYTPNPGASGADSFTYTITDGQATSNTATVNVNIIGQLTITTTTLPNGAVGQNYDQTIVATGGVPPYNWTIPFNSIPGGLVLTADGRLQGVPGASGTFNLGVQVQDSAPLPDTFTQPLTIVIGPPLITTGSLPNATRLQSYNQTLTAVGTTGATTWSLLSGTPPAGLTLNADGTITGTASAGTCSTANFTVQVQDSANPVQTATKALSIGMSGTLTITTSSPTSGVVFENLAALSATCGSGTKTWTVDSGSLPPGVTLNAGGSFSGQPKAAGTFTFVARVTDTSGFDTKSITINVWSLEQQVFGQTSSPAVPLAATRRVAQVLTAGTAFNLTAIRIPNISSCSGTTTIGAEIRPVTGAPARPDETGVPLATANVVTDAAGAYNNTLKLSSSVPMPQHARFAVVLSFTGGSCQGTNWQTADNYAGGDGWVNDNGAGWQLMGGALGRPDMPIYSIVAATGLLHFSSFRGNQAWATLADGRVLLIGPGLTADIYDPVTDTLSGTGAPGTARDSGATATLVGTKVYVIGGQFFDSNSNTTSSLANVEVFDPAANAGAGAFSVAGTLNVGRSMPTATLLSNGKILVAGGGLWSGTSFQAQQSAELYNPADGSVSALFNMLSARSDHTATIIPGTNKVLLAGGFSSGNGQPRTAEVYDPAGGPLGTFTGSANQSQNHIDYTATALTAGPRAGQIMLIGGGGDYPDLAAVTEFFNPATSMFSNGPSLLTPRIFHASAVLSDGRIVVLGGNNIWTAGARQLSDIEIYDPIANQFTRLGDLRVDRRRPTVTQLTTGPNAGKVFVAAGSSPSYLSSHSGEFFSVAITPFVVTTTSLPAGTTGAVYPGAQVQTSGGTGTGLTFTKTWGDLPAGLSISSTGVITGTPTGAGGTSAFVVTVTDSAANTTSASLTLSINALTFQSPSSLPNGAPNVAYSYQLLATGAGAVTFALDVNGALPPGVSLDSGGLIHGMPSTANFYSFNVRASDATGQSLVKSFTISVEGQLTITTSSIDPAVATWTNFTSCLSKSGGSGTSTWILTGGALPSGITLGANGCLTGVAVKTGLFPFSVQVSDAVQQSAAAALTLRVGTVDQNAWSIDQQAATPTIAFGGATSVAQSFTPALDGYLLSIGMTASCSNADIHLEIRAGAVPTATVLASGDTLASQTGAFQPGNAFARQFKLSAPVFLAKGVPVSLVLSSPGSCNVVQTQASGGGFDFTYPYGDAYTGTTGNWTAIGVADPTRPDLPFYSLMDEGGRFGFMSAGRSQHTATLLTTGVNAGMVLLAGGNTATTQLYNPTALPINGVAPGEFANGPSLSKNRSFHTATRFSDGWVLVAGGYDENGIGLATTELYNPATNTWSPGPSMPVARWAHSTTLLAGDKALFAGGHDVTWNIALTSTEVLTYNPATHTGSFVAGPSMAAGRSEHAAVLLNDGRVLLAGGWGTAPNSGAELYDPGTNGLQLIGPMQLGRARLTGTLLQSGKVLLAGGSQIDVNASATTVELFDPTANSFTTIGSIAPRENHQAIRLNGGRVVLAGGADHAFVALSTIDVFDPATQLFTAAGDMAVARAGFTATHLADDTVLLAGGYGPFITTWMTSEIFHPATDVFGAGVVNTAFSASVPGFGSAPNTFTRVTGTLPANVSIDPSTGAIGGTPIVVGVARATIEIADSSNPVQRRLRTVAVDVKTVGNVPVALGLSPGAVSVTPPGATAQLTVSVGAPLVTDLLVTLVSSNPGAASVPASVTILAGQVSAVFNVTAGASTGSATITASASGLTSAQAVVAAGTDLVQWVVDLAREPALFVDLQQPAFRIDDEWIGLRRRP